MTVRLILRDDLDPIVWLTVAQAAEHLQVNERTIRRLLASGELTGHRPTPRMTRFSRDDLDAWLRSRCSTRPVADDAMVLPGGDAMAGS